MTDIDSATNLPSVEPDVLTQEFPSSPAPSLNEFAVNPPVSLPEPPLALKPVPQKFTETIIERKSGFSVEQQRERTRTGLAVSLLTLLTLSVVGVSAYIVGDLWNPKELSQERRNMHRELMTILWTSQVTLAGSALGFYCGSQKDQPR